jgi:starch phosphorylase
MEHTALMNALSDLALDLRWSWNHAADELWNQLDPDLWNLTHNAWLVLHTLSGARIDAVRDDEKFLRKLDEVIADRRERNTAARWFQTAAMWPETS